MNNENNNGVIDFDGSSFLNSNNEVTESPKEVGNTLNTNQGIDASTLNVDDIFGTWSSDDVTSSGDLTPLSNDYNNSDVAGGGSLGKSLKEPDLSNDNNASLEDNVFNTSPDSSSVDTSSDVFANPFGENVVGETPSFDANAGSFSDDNSGVTGVTFDVSGGSLDNSSSLNGNSNSTDVTGSVEVNPTSLNGNSNSFEASNSVEVNPNLGNIVSPVPEVVPSEFNNQGISQSFNDGNVTVNTGVTPNNEVNNILSNDTGSNPTISSLQEALSTPDTGDNQITFNNPLNGVSSNLNENNVIGQVNSFDNKASNGENGVLPSNSSDIVSPNPVEINPTENNNLSSPSDNGITLDGSISVGTVSNPNSQVSGIDNQMGSDTKDTSLEKKGKKKISTPIIMLVLIIVISVGVIILNRNTLMDFFQTLLNK